MALKLNEVLGKLNKIGLAKTNRFMIEFAGNLPLPLAESNRRFAFMCHGAVIPSKSFSTVEISRNAGPLRKYPYSKQVNNKLEFNFYLGKDMFERLFFEVWQSKIQNPKTFSFRYPDSYSAELKVYHLNENNQLLYATKLVKAFPDSIADLTYDTSAKNALMMQTVSISFQHAYYGIPMPRGKSNTIMWEDDVNPPEDFGVIDPAVDVSAKNSNFTGKIIEAVASAGSVLLRGNNSPADWLTAGSILLSQGTPEYYETLNIFNVILGNKPQGTDSDAPVINIPGL